MEVLMEMSATSPKMVSRYANIQKMKDETTYKVTDIHNCPDCGGGTLIKGSRVTHIGGLGTRHRRRMCIKCNHRFSTYEMPRAYIVGLLEDRLKFRKLIKLVELAQLTPSLSDP